MIYLEIEAYKQTALFHILRRRVKKLNNEQFTLVERRVNKRMLKELGSQNTIVSHCNDGRTLKPIIFFSSSSCNNTTELCALYFYILHRRLQRDNEGEKESQRDRIVTAYGNIGWGGQNILLPKIHTRKQGFEERRNETLILKRLKYFKDSLLQFIITSQIGS